MNPASLLIGLTLFTAEPPTPATRPASRAAAATTQPAATRPAAVARTGTVARVQQQDYALDFRPGLNSHVSIRNLKYTAGTLTIEAWVKPREADLPADHWGAVIGNLEKQRGFGLGQRRSQWTFRAWTTGKGDAQVSSGETVVSDRWVHLAGVLEGRQIRLYVDGKLQDQATVDGQFKPSNMPILIGADPNLTGGVEKFTGFPGLIDEVRISSSALYTKDFVPPPVLDKKPGTVVLCHLDEGADHVARDATSHKNDGAIHGAEYVPVNPDEKKPRQ